MAELEAVFEFYNTHQVTDGDNHIIEFELVAQDEPSTANSIAIWPANNRYAASAVGLGHRVHPQEYVSALPGGMLSISGARSTHPL